MKRTFLLLIMGCLMVLPMQAVTKEQRKAQPHELRLTLSDMLMETLMWHGEGYHYTPHLGMEYQYAFNHWLSMGCLVDFQHTRWTEHFYNLTILPTVRFTYFWHPNVNIYSSLAYGLNVNGGSELDIYDKHTAVGFATDIALLGISFGKDRWFGSVEAGGLFAFKNASTIYMAGARLLTVSIGVKL